MTMQPNTTAVLIRRRQSSVDEYGDTVYAETFDAYPGIFWPAGSTEAVAGRDQVAWSTTLCLPASADVTAAIDAVIPQAAASAVGVPVLDSNGSPQGQRFEVEGTPNVWPTTPWGWRPDFPVEIQLKAVTG